MDNNCSVKFQNFEKTFYSKHRRVLVCQGCKQDGTTNSKGCVGNRHQTGVQHLSISCESKSCKKPTCGTSTRLFKAIMLLQDIEKKKKLIKEYKSAYESILNVTCPFFSSVEGAQSETQNCIPTTSDCIDDEPSSSFVPQEDSDSDSVVIKPDCNDTQSYPDMSTILRKSMTSATVSADDADSITEALPTSKSGLANQIESSYIAKIAKLEKQIQLLKG